MLQPLRADILLSYCGKSANKINLPLKNKTTSVSTNKTDEQCGKTWWMMVKKWIFSRNNGHKNNDRVQMMQSLHNNTNPSEPLCGCECIKSCKSPPSCGFSQMSVGLLLHTDNVTVNEATFVHHLPVTASWDGLTHVWLLPTYDYFCQTWLFDQTYGGVVELAFRCVGNIWH